MSTEVPLYDEMQSVKLEALLGALDTLTAPYVQKHVGKLVLERDLGVCLEAIGEVLDQNSDQEVIVYDITAEDIEKEKQLETLMYRYNREGWFAYMNEVGMFINGAIGLPANF